MGQQSDICPSFGSVRLESSHHGLPKSAMVIGKDFPYNYKVEIYNNFYPKFPDRWVRECLPDNMRLMTSKRDFCILVLLFLVLASSGYADDSNVIEKQLAEIGTIHNEEVVIVQRKYTRKNWRHEFTPITFGGVPFGTVRRTLFGGASYTLHLGDGFGIEFINFLYSKTFFSAFTDDINANRLRKEAEIKPDYQKLLYFLSCGVQITPFYGKVSTFSRWIAYIEPYISLGAGLAKTEIREYPAFVPGIGIRAFFREWFSMRIEFRDYIYSEKFTARTNPVREETALRSNYAMMLSLSFWLPKMPN